MILGDFNEWHYIVDANAYKNQTEGDGTNHPVAILRATNSNDHEDAQYANQIRLCRAADVLVGHYGNMVPGVDAFSQGVFFGNTVKKYGGLQPGEPIYCDVEMSGDTEAMVVAFLSGAHSVLGDPTQDEGLYSGASFYAVNLTSAPKTIHRWLAAYGQSSPPPYGEDDWQYEDNHAFSGCNLPTADGTIYNGTLDQFKALFGFGQPLPAPQPAPAPAPRPPVYVPPFVRLLVYRPGRVMTHGADVLEWQQKMLQRGWRGIGAADSIYGGKSATVCHQFEQDQHLSVDAGPYGIVGPQVWHATWLNPVTH